MKDRLRLKYKNYVEAAVISMLVDNFVHCGVTKEQFTVITPFREQLLLLQEHLQGVPVLTIDRA